MMHPRGPAAANDAAAANVQSIKVRRLQQGLFLKEMERLADAMCRHYLEARQDVEAVAPGDIRGHIDTIHTRVHQAVRGDLDEVSGSRLVAELQGAQTVSATTGMVGTDGSLSGRRGSPDPRSGARPPNRDQSEWTAQESRGVALRLRRVVPVSMGPELARSRAEGQAQLHRGAVEPLELNNPLHIHRFHTDDLRQVALLDLNMDNNTSCLSARRPALNPVEASLRNTTRAQMILPKPPAKRYPREVVHALPTSFDEYQEQQQQSTALLSVPSGGGGGTMLPTVSSLVGASNRQTVWSPRDTLFRQSLFHSTTATGKGTAGGAAPPPPPLLPLRKR